MSKQATVLQMFWTRTMESPEAPSLFIRNTDLLPSTQPGSHGRKTIASTAPYLPISASKMGGAVANVSAYLRKQGFKRGDRAAIIAWNCPEWVIAAVAVQSLGGVTVPIYPDSSPEQVNYVLKDSTPRFIFSNDPAQLDKLAADSDCQPVLFDNLAELLTGAECTEHMPFVHHFRNDATLDEHPHLRQLIEAELVHFHQDPTCGLKWGDLATIIYTSGSTGNPKGVMLTHGNFAAESYGLINHGFDVHPQTDVYLSYLPLAHVYEQACGAMLCLYTGVPMAFSSVDEVAEAIQSVRPTLLHGVPKVWRKVKEKVQGEFDKATGLKRWIIDWAMAQTEPGFKRWLANLLVFKKIKGKLGGRLRTCTSGGAALPSETIVFFGTTGVRILQGYGLSETTGPGHVTKPNSTLKGKEASVGELITGLGLQVRIVPVPGQEDSGDGEIQYKGPTVMVGYWNRPAETAKAFTEDGWFKTGDRGRIDEDGYLYIVGRIKREGKNEGGKYISPAKIEAAFDSFPLVQFVVPVFENRKYTSGLIFLNPQVALELLGKAGVAAPTGPNLAAFLASHPVIQQAVQAAVDAANTKLEKWEQVKKFRVMDVEPTEANGLLSRKKEISPEKVLKEYKDLIEAMYQEPKAA